MNLEIQHSVYTFDTACFYTDKETALDHRLQSLRKKLADNQQRLEDIAKMEQEQAKRKAEAAGEPYTTPSLPYQPDAKSHLRKKEKVRRQRSDASELTLEEKRAHRLSRAEIAQLNLEIRQTKDQLKREIQQNRDLDRQVRQESFTAYNVVAIFDSALTRSLGMRTDGINDQLVIVKVYYFGVAENIIKRGFWMNGEHYVFFSASAGQIRTKKLVAIKESAYQKCRDQLTCGLSQDDINAAGGININKYLAYLALCNSATSPWPEFDIDKTIVIDDFETQVPGLVDFIDEGDYSITRKEESVPIAHTDGCGMVLPRLSKVNMMVRAPWVKGLLASFPFDMFIREANKKDPSRNHGLIKDIYGQEHDVLLEGIQVIFTRSQFKLYKFFDSWGSYQLAFKKYGCTAGKCNEEPKRIPSATFNYQMLQTLHNMTDEELSTLCQRTNQKLRDMSSDRQTMLQIFGATKDHDKMNSFQKCLAYYPELLQDPYCRETLRDLKNSMELRALGGKLDIAGKFLFLIPDLYAACEHWFCGVDTPEGLLGNGEVYCRVYKNEPEMDVLRSPHLYKEHCIRSNTYQKNQEARRWFRTDGIYTSSHDLISKVLQFDNDGDRALVCVDKTIVEVAKRECSDVVPLYYPMAKTGAAQITQDTMYDGMVAAWTGGNIGEISNQITKIWASERPDEEAVKVLCLETNFTIDFAKTGYKPTRPPEWDVRIKALTKGKVPRFFLYAKDKTVEQVAPPSQSVIDRLLDKIQSYKFDFQKRQLGFFDYRMLMHDPELEIGEREQELIDTYYQMASNLGNYNLAKMDEDNVYAEALNNIRAALGTFGGRRYVTDVLVKQLFDVRHAVHKAVFWDIYGDVVYQNLLDNQAGERKMCQRCGKRFTPLHNRQCLCETCAAEVTSVPEKPRVAICVDCGKEFIPSDLKQTRCPVCQWVRDNPVQTNHIGTCMACGAPFDIERRRGRRQLLCKRCQEVNRRLQYKNAKQRKSGKKR